MATATAPNALGVFLKSRREEMDPAALDLVRNRRRTPGLRREEVAGRADVSTTWYTWLEQGRGGAPSAAALGRIADALRLTPPEREHAFLLAGRGAPAPTSPPPRDVPPRLQGVLDAFGTSPAYLRTATWDVVAWNRAAAAVLTDYGRLEPGDRNILRRLFTDADARARLLEWAAVARHAVAAFRLETSRYGGCERAAALVDELSDASAEFAAFWRDGDVDAHGGGTKLMLHPDIGPLALEYSAFAVDGRPDLQLVVFTPATPADAEGVDRAVTGC